MGSSSDYTVRIKPNFGNSVTTPTTIENHLQLAFEQEQLEETNRTLERLLKEYEETQKKTIEVFSSCKTNLDTAQTQVNQTKESILNSVSKLEKIIKSDKNSLDNYVLIDNNSNHIEVSDEDSILHSLNQVKELLSKKKSNLKLFA